MDSTGGDKLTKKTDLTLLAWPVILAKVMRVAVGGGVSLGEQQNLCGDYIFSGHTMILAVSYLTVRDCKIVRVIVELKFALRFTKKAVFSSLGCPYSFNCRGSLKKIVKQSQHTKFQVVMLLLGRGHYSIDVLLAYYVTTRWASQSKYFSFRAM